MTNETIESRAATGPAATADETRYWDHARSLLAVDDGGDANIASLLAGRHVTDGRGGDVAIRFIAKRTNERTVTTYADLAEQSGRLARALRELGVERGDTVALLAGRAAPLYVAALGAWRAGGVVCPLFAAFGPGPIRQRLELGDAKVLITDSVSYRRKIQSWRSELTRLSHVVLVDDPESAQDASTVSMSQLIAASSVLDDPAPTHADDPAILHFTSGTTGTPKGALHVHGAAVAHVATALDVFSLGADDVYWCTADPGWVTGTSYGIIAPLAIGATMIVDEGDFDAERWYSTIERERVTVLYTAPTAIRMLMRAGEDLPRQHDLSSLRLVASVGEPLSAEAVRWGSDALGLSIRDSWWQTETGAIMIATPSGSDVRPGSMGRPVAGVTAGLLACDDEGVLSHRDGHVVEVDDPDRIGMIALRPGWPSMFRDYLGAHERYRAAFEDGWYLSGDLARRDADGWYWFVGRADDVIKTAGHLIGPFEVESVLNEHPDVVASGVYGMPDPIAGNVIHAEVVLRAGVDADDSTMSSVMAHARRHLGSAVAPRSIIAVPSLPYTRSGKVMRRVLRARALGIDEGDTSTLEPATGSEPARPDDHETRSETS